MRFCGRPMQISNLRGVRKNSAWGSAYRLAFEEVLRRGQSQYVIIMDADLSHDPAELVQLSELVKHYPAVVGSRYTAGGKVVRWSLPRRLISRFGNVYARMLTGVPAADLTRGYAAYQTDWLKRVPFQNMKSDGYAFQIELKYLLYSLGAKIYEHPITFEEREKGKSKFSLAIVLEGVWYPLKIFLARITNFKP